MSMVEKWLWAVAPSMLMVQLFNTGLQLLSKLILSRGSFIFAIMTYRHLVASFCVAPFAFLLEREKKDGSKKELSGSVWLWLFLNALTGITMAMGLYYYGLKDTSATYAVNFLNLIPIVTFLFSILVRIEKLGLETIAGKMKTAGAILCVGGAITTGLYKGKGFHISNHHLINDHVHHVLVVDESKVHWGRGTAMLVCSCLSYATWFIVQVKLMKIYPLKYRATMLTCLVASLQSAIIGLCIDRDPSSWRLGWNLQLLTIVYSGALATAASFCLISWAVANRGPTYPSMFNPLSLIFVAVLEGLLFGELIRVGTILGMIMIIGGLYSFLWGRGRESKSSVLQSNAHESQGITLSTAVVMPTTSPIHSDIEQMGSDHHRIENGFRK